MANIQSVAIFGLLMASVLSAPLIARAADDKDIEALQGRWKLTSFVSDGKDITKEKGAVEVVIKGKEYSWSVDGKVTDKGTITLDSSKNPKGIEYTGTFGEYRGRTFIGIYTLDKDTYKTCDVPKGKDRPTDFTSTPGSSRDAATYKRAKD
jgi:uncharacterized protein (TIGR03067 family)